MNHRSQTDVPSLFAGEHEQPILPLMHTAEIAMEPERKELREELVWSESKDLPPILLREQLDRKGIEAISAIRLAGVAWNCGRTRDEASAPHSNQSNALEKQLLSVFTAIKTEQRLELTFTRRPKETGAASFEWRIVSRIFSDASALAQERSEEFWLNANILLKGLSGSYHFIAVTAKEELSSESGAPWQVQFSPGCVAVGVTAPSQIGFVLNETHSGRAERSLLVSVDAGNIKGSRDSLIRALGNSNQEFEFVFSCEFFQLSEKARCQTARALEWLRNGSPKRIKYADDVNIDQDQTLGCLEKNLEEWCRNPRGYRISCRVRSGGPVPLAFLHSFGSEIFSGSFAIRSQTNANRPDSRLPEGGSDELDLRDCYNTMAQLPPVFPSAAALSNVGVSRFYAPPVDKFEKGGALLGCIDGWSSGEREVRIAEADRQCHAVTIGSTGTGKSTLLATLVKHSIENGEGVILLDPHGDLYRQALEAIPAHRAKDAVLVDFTDFDRAVGINFLECRGSHRQMQMHFVTNELIKIFDRLYDLRLTGGPLFETYMRSALLLIMDNEFEGGTLLDVPFLFEDRDFRRFLVEHCRDPYIKKFWSSQAEQASGELSLSNMAPYVTSKLNQFTSNALLRSVIGQSRSTIDFREIIDRGQILLVNLSKGLLSQLDAQLLGMLIMGKVFCAAMERATDRGSERRKAFMFVDEFGNFATDTAANILSESRKFGLHMTMAFQNLSQLSANEGKQNLLESLLGNVGSLMLFRMGPPDAEKLVAYTRPDFEAKDLQDLPNYHAVARLLIDNHPSRPFVFKTIPVQGASNSVEVERIADLSRSKYTVPRNEVEESILRRRNSYSQS